MPAGAIFVSPSGSDSASGSSAAPLRTIQTALNRASVGSTVVLRAGTYHENVVLSKNNVTLQSYPGEAVWLDGSVPVDGWTRSGSTWVHGGWSARFDRSSSFAAGVNNPQFIDPAYPLAAWPDQVFVDGAKLRQVADAGSVVAGTFAVDYDAKTLTLGTDPTGREIRGSDLDRAMTITGVGVVVRGLGIRRYATAVSQMGTVRVYGNYGTVQNVVVTDNASQAMTFLNSHNTADHVTVVGNGMTGIHGNQADFMTVTNSIVQGNNAERFNPSPATGGMKITRSTDLTISNNLVADNASNGIWLDESIRRFTITNNDSLRNTKGIVIELSDTGIAAGNDIDGASYGMYLLGTGNVDVYNNSFANISTYQLYLAQDARRQASPGAVGRDPRMPVPDTSCPWITRNITIANNTFTTTGTYQLVVKDSATNTAADDMNLMVDGNVFAQKVSATMIAWGNNDNRTMTMWQSASAFDAAKRPSARNMQTANGSTQQAALSGQRQVTPANAVPLPADVAAAVDQPVGTRHLGSFPPSR